MSDTSRFLTFVILAWIAAETLPSSSPIGWLLRDAARHSSPAVAPAASAASAAAAAAAAAAASAASAAAPRDCDSVPCVESDVDFDGAGALEDPEISFLEVDYRGLTFVVSHLHHEWVTKKEQHVMAALFDAVAAGRAASSSAAGGDAAPRQCSVLDVGMNDGFFSMMAARLGCRVVSFELQEKCIRVARRALVYNGDEAAARVTIVHRPVADAEGLLMTLPYDRNWCSGMFGFANKGCGEKCNPSFAESKTFRSVALQDHFAEGWWAPLPSAAAASATAAAGATVFDFLKIDVEGFDPQAMRGALGLFRARRVRVAVVEIHPGSWHPDANVTQANWVAYDILGFGYSAQCLTNPGQVFRAAEDRTRFWTFAHSDTCVDYRFGLEAA